MVCVIGPAGVETQATMIDAAEAAGVRRFIVNHFGWGPGFRNLPEFDEIGAKRKVALERARQLSQSNSEFTWTSISIGNPIDWVRLLCT